MSGSLASRRAFEFADDKQMCACGHRRGMHGSDTVGDDFAGIGMGQCAANHWRRGDPWLDITDPPCECGAFVAGVVEEVDQG